MKDIEKEIQDMTAASAKAQKKVEQQQEVVNTLSQKLNDTGSRLAVADANKESALSTKNSADQLLLGVVTLKQNIQLFSTALPLLAKQTDYLQSKMKALFDQLQYSFGLLVKLVNVVLRKKAQNPLISDELVVIAGKAVNNANNVLALMMEAMHSLAAVHPVNMNLQAIAAEGKAQSFTFLSANEVLVDLSAAAYDDAQEAYTKASQTNAIVKKKVNVETMVLNNEQANLQSLQAGLAAMMSAVK
ncbi:MAG: hypothetical protein ACKOXB_04755 [Flavobacteriales bacterium]